MSQHDDLNRIVAALSRAAFNDTHWSVASALIDGACRVKSNTLFYGYEHFSENPQLFFIRLCYHGQRNKELERVYIDEYYPWDEAVPRVRRLHDSQVVHVRDPLYRTGAKKPLLPTTKCCPNSAIRTH